MAPTVSRQPDTTSSCRTNTSTPGPQPQHTSADNSGRIIHAVSLGLTQSKSSNSSNNIGNMNKKKKDWREEKAKLLSMSLEERQRQYRAEHVTLDKILTWRQMREAEEDGNNLLMDKVSLYKGDITALEVDAIVNAANSSLLGGGGVDGCIHKAAGPLLFDECHTLHGCDTGNAKITCGYDLPAKYVIHTVGPVARGSVGPTENRDLAACYKKSLQLAKDNDLHSVAFPCISTGIYGFPNEPAANIALSTVKNWLKNNSQMERVIFCVFLDMDYKIYKDKLSQFFPDNEESGEENDRELKEGDPVPPEQQDQTEDIHEDKGIKAEDSELEKDLPAKKEEVGEEEKEDDVAMQSQQQDTPDPPEENGRKDTSAGEHDGETTHPGEEETGSSAMVAAEEEEEEKMETGSSQEPSVLDDKPVDCVSREVEMKASTEGLQGSDLTQTDSTQSKDLENNE